MKEKLIVLGFKVKEGFLEKEYPDIGITLQIIFHEEITFVLWNKWLNMSFSTRLPKNSEKIIENVRNFELEYGRRKNKCK